MLTKIRFENPVQLFPFKGRGAIIHGTGVHGIQPIFHFWNSANDHNGT